MNPRRLLVPVAALVLCPWLAETASAQRPRVERVKPPATVEIPEKEETSRPKARRARQPRMVRALPDIACSLSASENEDGTDPIPGEGVVSYGGGAPSVWVRVTVGNPSPVPTGEFFGWIDVKRNGVILAHPYYGSPLGLASLAPGETRTLSPIEIPLTGTTNKVEALAFFDHARSGGDHVAESNEKNNACVIRITGNVVH